MQERAIVATRLLGGEGPMTGSCSGKAIQRLREELTDSFRRVPRAWNLFFVGHRDRSLKANRYNDLVRKGVSRGSFISDFFGRRSKYSDLVGKIPTEIVGAKWFGKVWIRK